MPYSLIQIAPGVNTVQTQTLNRAGISRSNLIRFRQGLPEKMGGWERLVTNSMGSLTKALHAWEDLAGLSWLGVGSINSLKAIQSGNINDVTPQTFLSSCVLNLSVTVGSSAVTIVDTNLNNLSKFSSVYFNTPIVIGGMVLAGMYALNGDGTGTSYIIDSGQIATSTVANAGAVPSFTTAANNFSVTVNFNAHHLVDGESFYAPIPTIVGGITISGGYTVGGVTTNSFVINAASVATSTATVSMNAGSAQFLYYVGLGPAYTTSFGALGPIGQFAIGEGFARTVTTSPQTGTPIQATDWTIDNWGEIMLACPDGGPIFYWPPNAGFINAVPVGTGPSQNTGIFVSMPQQILVAYGSAKTLLPGNLDSSRDFLMVRWSDQEDFTNWDVSPLTLAGSFHLPNGSKIVGAAQAANSAFILTDVDAYSMSYLGYPLVFSFNQIGVNCGLIGKHAVIAMDGSIFWMSNSNFYFTSGASSVQSIPCTVWDNVFQDLDATNAYKAVAGGNSDFNEIFFFYPSISGGTGENDKYVKYNKNEGIWDYGTLARSAWTNRSVVGPPIGADPSTYYLQQHESGYGNDGAAMDSFFETGYFAYGDGENFAVVDHFDPDMKWHIQSSALGATMTMTMTAVNFPNSSQSMTNALTMTSTTEYLTPRLRGRQLRWKVESNDAANWWRMGNVRYRWAPAGRRG